MRDIAFIALGSNLGDRAAFLDRARHALGALPRSHVVATSDVEETPPLGPSPQGKYLNQMVALDTELPPLELLHALHEIERALGRVRTERWAARTIDLDIVSFARQTVAEAGLVCPHPELGHRDFWQRELAQVRAALATAMQP